MSLHITRTRAEDITRTLCCFIITRTNAEDITRTLAKDEAEDEHEGFLITDQLPPTDHRMQIYHSLILVRVSRPTNRTSQLKKKKKKKRTLSRYSLDEIKRKTLCVTLVHS